jgi:hopanoid biosynthesis associated membrane protein HpnM
VTAQAKRTHKVEKLARIYDEEIAPCWGARFARLLLRNLVVPERGQVLDVSCGTGAPTIEILRRMTEGSRLIAIDESSAMLDVVRRKVARLGPLGNKAVFFRTERALPKLSFADDVYDLVVCNLGLGDMPSIEAALRDFARVAKPGGEVRCTLPLAGTFGELHDLYREVLIKHDRHDALVRLDDYIARYPTFDRAERWLAAADLEGGLEVEEFSLVFRSSREFFLAPVIERVFDLDAVLAASIGLSWAALPAEQKAALATAFRRYTVSSYATSFNSYNGQSFQVSPTVRTLRNGQVVVNSRFLRANGSSLALDYVMRRGPAGWQAVDVLTDGSISRVAVQRSDFRGLLSSGGTPALVVGLEHKVANLSGGTEG